MKPIIVRLFLLICLLIQIAYGQQAPASKAQPQSKPISASTPKTDSKPKPTDSFVCPDTKAQKACDSYQELRKARDSSLEDFFSGSGIAFVCFREDEDQFFLLRFDKPAYLFKRHFDRDLKKTVIDDDATQSGSGYTIAFDNGIENSGIVPSFPFSGTWSYFGELGSYFKGKRAFQKLADDKSEEPLITIDESQFNVNDYKYTNGQDKPVHYNLTIQRSTGRFTENFRTEDEKIPFIDRAGRCLVQPK